MRIISLMTSCCTKGEIVVADSTSVRNQTQSFAPSQDLCDPLETHGSILVCLFVILFSNHVTVQSQQSKNRWNQPSSTHPGSVASVLEPAISCLNIVLQFTMDVSGRDAEDTVAPVQGDGGDEPVDTTFVDALVQGTEDVDGSANTPAKAKKSASRLPSLTPRTSVHGSRRSSIGALVLAEVDSFFNIFGYLGVAMVILFLFSALWTFMLAFIQVYTNEMANTIMNTTTFDNGRFWTLPQPDTSVVVVSVILLTIFGFGYLGLAIYMLFFRRRRTHGGAVQPAIYSNAEATRRGPLRRGLEWVKNQFLHPTPLKRHYFVR